MTTELISIISNNISCIAVAMSKDKIWINPLEVLVLKLKENKLTITLHKKTIDSTYYCAHAQKDIQYVTRAKKTTVISNHENKSPQQILNAIQNKLLTKITVKGK
ncbi:MAG: hypothetical protein ACKO96_05035 [Flammeovirgaceae bacterium]